MKVNPHKFFNALIFIVGILFSVISVNTVSGQQFTWKQRADHGGGGVYDPFAMVIGTKAYVGTGRILPLAMSVAMWEYDPATDIWTQVADFPGTGRYGAKAFGIGSFGYVGSGWDPTPQDDFYRYNPQSNTWTTVPSFLNAERYTASAFAIGNKGYFGLGYSPCRNDFWKFDPNGNVWTQVANYPGNSRQAASSFVIGDFAYVGLGLCPGTNYNDFHRYDPLTNTWMAIAPFPGLARNAAYSFSIGSNGYVGMGYNYLSNNQPFDIYTDFWRYNSLTDTWMQLPDFPGTKMFAGVSFSVAGKGYAGMGSDTIFNTHFLSEFWEYSPDAKTDITEVDSAPSFFPSPVTDFLTVHSNTSAPLQGIRIYDVSGKCVAALKEASLTIRIDLSSLSPGIYFGQIVQDGDKSSAIKIMKL